MSFPYTGTDYVPLNTLTGFSQDTNPPRIGFAPTIIIPADADPNTVATMLLGQYRQIADFITYLQKSAEVRPTRGFLSNTQRSITPIVQVGTGTGTILPTTVVAPTSGAFYFFKIILGGVPGVATYQVSTNGGVTFGAVTPVPVAPTVEPFIGASFTWAGLFVAGDNYSFLPSDVPIAKWYGNAGISGANGTPGESRTEIDHLGFFQRRHMQIEESWLAGLTTPIGGGFGPALVPGNSLWQAETSAFGGSITMPGTGSGSDKGTRAILNTGSVLGGLARMRTFAAPFALNAAGQLVAAEFTCSPGTVALTNNFAGITNNANFTAATDFFGFRRTIADGTTIAVVKVNNVFIAQVDIGALWIGERSFRIEVWESGASGAVARFFAGNPGFGFSIPVLEVPFTVNAATAACGLGFASEQPGAGAITPMQVFRVRAQFTGSLLGT